MDIDTKKLTPMMKQYLEIKDNYQDTILFYRLGDFYEMFFEDAIVASQALEIALTGRNAGLEEKIPMCGVPYHASEAYIKKLLELGYKVAICEQTQSPSEAKGIVKRDVVKILTPGVNEYNDNNSFNYLMYIDDSKSNFYYLSLCDLQTGKLKATRIEKNVNSLYKEILSQNIKEVLLSENFNSSIFDQLLKTYELTLSFIKDDLIDEVLTIKVEDEYQKGFTSIMSYLKNNFKMKLDYFMEVEYSTLEVMNLDLNSKQNLELINNMRTFEKYGSLFWYLDHTKTTMGSRLLKEFIENPLINENAIIQRQMFIQSLLDNFISLEAISTLLKKVYDISRIAGKIGLNSINPKEMLWLNNSLLKASEIKEELYNTKNEVLVNYAKDLNCLDNLQTRIEYMICNDIIEGNSNKIINDGVNEQLDEYRRLVDNSTAWLVDFEQRQKDLTGIKNLKVKYNKVFGYYIEVSNANKDLIKDEYGYVRKQTLTNAERYINSELKDMESNILNAHNNVEILELELFNEFKLELKSNISEIQLLANKLSFIDVMQSLCKISSQFGYSKPVFSKERIINIKDSFHPIIKELDNNQEFVNNDIIMNEEDYVMIITGPNMGGKSTYMRQLALISIMAQIGCYVPASSANLMIFKNIYTRIGANDDLINGKSTFMVEMSEASNAILNADEDSLILFDEIGRGTATYDGMSLACSMIEYICQNNKAKTMFSTHYHELVELANQYDGIKNYYASVYENQHEITFTYKILPGSIDKSYGIHVAKLANLPDAILTRANQLLKQYESKQIVNNQKVVYIEKEDNKYETIINELKNTNVESLRPIEALILLEKLQKEIGDISE